MNKEVTFSWSELAAVTGGQWLCPPPASGGICGLTDDSRLVEPDCLFIAIPGELTDGHRYLGKAAQAGAGALLVSRAPSAEELSGYGIPCLLVSDSLRAFQALSSAYRQRFSDCQILGITGSCGKTSTKEMCAAVLSGRWPGHVLKTEGNTNNFFGVPRNLLRLDSGTAAAVIEMGTNNHGEIDRLATIVRPDVALICNIGHAHLEAFRDLRGVATEKSAIFRHCAAGGTVIFPEEAEGRDIILQAAGNRKHLTFGVSASSDIRCQYLGPQADGLFGVALKWKATGQSITFRWSIGGAHQALNAAAAAAVGTVFGMTPEQIAAQLQEVTLPGQRMEIVKAKGLNWANDAYNANPDSFRASLDWFAEVCPPGAKQFLLLGDMRELGETADRAHAEILEQAIAKFPQGAILTVGPNFRPHALAHQLPNFEDAQAAGEALLSQAPAGAWVLLKASNSIGLYKLCKE